MKNQMNVLLRGRIMASLLVLSIFTVLLAGCSKGNEPTELLISAAASLKSSMEELQAAYKKSHPEVTLTYNFAGSGTLEEQIREGAPADIFFSAAQKQMNSLEADNLIDSSTRADLLSNEIVLVVPKDSTLDIGDFSDIVKAKVVAIGDPESVPAGQYAKEVFDYLGIWEDISVKASLGKDVTEVLAWVGAGSAEAGVVYKTDAALTDNVEIAAAAPEGSYQKAVYPAAVINASKNKEAAKEFLEFLNSEEADSIFTKYGFDIAD